MAVQTARIETSKVTWYAVDIVIDPTAAEAVEYALLEAGASGAEERTGEGGETIITGYFPHLPEREEMRTALAEALRIYDLPTSSAREMSLRDIPEHDWLAEWKRTWQPTVVGRFVIAPPWSEVEPAAGRIIIRIEPGMAFGTGTHETTRLCLRAIEEHFRGGSFLDVGTGTGILAIAAAKIDHEARIDACDNDADAVTIAIENAELNGVGKAIAFRVGSLDLAASADMVCANLTADVILPMLGDLVSVSCGRLVLSGILAEQAGLIQTKLVELGVEDFQTLDDGEWVAIVV
ncbi:MAG: 50S ribosomal protein L11 methyltransferase [Pyrinomonadaceae bacterium]